MCGKCCGNIPLQPDFWEKHKGKARKPYNIVKPNFVKGDFVQPVTEDGYCVFLRLNYTCAIYTDRPNVCKLQGNIPSLPCYYYIP